MQMSKKCVDLFWAHSPGQNFGVFKCSTSEKNFIRSIQNKTLNDISKFTYIIRSFTLNAPYKFFFLSMVFQNSKILSSDQVNRAFVLQKIIFNLPTWELVLVSNLFFKK